MAEECPVSSCLPHYQWDLFHPSSIPEHSPVIPKIQVDFSCESKRVFGVLGVFPGKRLESCAVGTGNLFGNNPWDQGKRVIM